jgi:hypothetical protein
LDCSDRRQDTGRGNDGCVKQKEPNRKKKNRSEVGAPNMDLIALGNEKKFEELCQALLQEEYPRFPAFSPPDLGMDGYDSDSKTIFQAYFPERSPRRDKIQNDLAKARKHEGYCCHWILLLPKNPSAALARWLESEERPRCQFTIEVWGLTRISTLLQKHVHVREQFFPVQRPRNKAPKSRPGDALPGREVTAEVAAELSQLITDIAEEAAARKKRRARQNDYAKEYGEFNAHFQLSAYDRLPFEKTAEARIYLERKRYGRRQGETVAGERLRAISGIKAIQSKLRISEQRYRKVLIDLTGKSSTTAMDLQELSRVFKHFRQMQGIAEVADVPK